MQKQFILAFMHGIEYGYGQEFFIENWPKNAQRGRAYELHSTLWNALDINVKLQINRTTFKFALLNSLIGEIQSETDELVHAEEHSH
jgi:hypothetical protein